MDGGGQLCHYIARWGAAISSGSCYACLDVPGEGERGPGPIGDQQDDNTYSSESKFDGGSSSSRVEVIEPPTTDAAAEGQRLALSVASWVWGGGGGAWALRAQAPEAPFWRRKSALGLANQGGLFL